MRSQERTDTESVTGKGFNLVILRVMPLEMEKIVTELMEKALRDSNVAWWEWDIPQNRVMFNDLKADMF
jgi:hypothetical protein